MAPGRAVRDARQWLQQDAPIRTDDSLLSFIPISRLGKYFEANLQNILSELFVADPPEQRGILSQRSPYIRVFAVLLLIGQAETIVEFLRSSSLDDLHCPFHGTAPPPEFPREVDWEEFSRQQWQFFPYEFHGHLQDRTIGLNHPLPFTRKSKITSGGSAHIYEIIIHKDYNHLISSLPDQPRPFALKTFYGADAKIHYERELSAFKRIKESRDHDHIVTCYTSFEYRETYNVILELCTGNLREYFDRNRFPRSNEHRTTFWENFTKVIRGVYAIHNCVLDSIPFSHRIDGFHQDLKLENILYIEPPNAKPFESTFKVGDLGLCHFKEGDNDMQIYAPDIWGTKRYGAPETYRVEGMERNTIHITNKADIWSLCCIISDAIAWTLFGTEEMERYASARKQETAKHKMPENSDCFHNGKRLLKIVEEIHQDFIVQCREEHDLITPRIITLIDGVLRKGNPDERLQAHTLIVELDELIRVAKSDLEQQKWSERLLNARPRSQHSVPNPSVSTSRTQVPDTQREMPPELPPDFESVQNVNASYPRSRLSAVLEQRIHDGPSGTYSFPNIGMQAQTTSDLYQDGSCSELLGPKLTGRRNSVLNGGPPYHQASSLIPQNTVPGVYGTLFPQLSVEQAENWITTRKRRNSLYRRLYPGGPMHLLPDGQKHLGRLREKDHIFILDDDGSMLPHWNEVCRLLQILAYMVKGMDDDGLDLYLASDRVKIHHTKSRRLAAAAREKQPSPTAISNLFDCLTLSLQQYRQNMSSKKRQNIYIFTTGNWSDETPAGRVDEVLRDFVRHLVRVGHRDRRIAIQLIQFGDDAKGTARLKYLDDLKHIDPSVEIDIVDHTHSDGNIWKMLLGATDDRFDAVDGAGD